MCSLTLGCISGAVLIEEYQRGLIDVGFSNVQVIDSGADFERLMRRSRTSRVVADRLCPLQLEQKANSACCAPAPASHDDQRVFENFTDLLARYNVNEYAASVKVYAVK
jgi:hypothetical protein